MEYTGVGNVDLLVAMMDLKLVQLLRGAMNAADAGAGKCASAHPLGPDPNCAHIGPRPQVHPTPHFNPRPVIQPAARFEPRPVIHPKPIEAPPAVCPPVLPEVPHVKQFHRQAPWQVLPWERSPQPIIQVKVHKPEPDIVRKGSLLNILA